MMCFNIVRGFHMKLLVKLRQFLCELRQFTLFPCKETAAILPADWKIAFLMLHLPIVF